MRQSQKLSGQDEVPQANGSYCNRKPSRSVFGQKGKACVCQASRIGWEAWIWKTSGNRLVHLQPSPTSALRYARA